MSTLCRLLVLAAVAAFFWWLSATGGVAARPVPAPAPVVGQPGRYVPPDNAFAPALVQAVRYPGGVLAVDIVAFHADGSAFPVQALPLCPAYPAACWAPLPVP